MIAVDIFADFLRLDEKDTERLHRVARVGIAAYRVESGIPDPTLFVDAALSVLDAIGSYLRYAGAREVTKQLSIEGDRLRAMLAELNKQLVVKEAIASERFAASLKKVRLDLKEQQIDIAMSEDRFASLSRQVKILGEIIALQRSHASPRSPTLLTLEAQYYRLVDSQLQFALNLINE